MLWSDRINVEKLKNARSRFRSNFMPISPGIPQPVLQLNRDSPLDSRAQKGRLVTMFKEESLEYKVWRDEMDRTFRII